MQTLDVPGIPAVDVSLFQESEIKSMEVLLRNGGQENLAALIHQMTPEKERVIGQIQAALRPQSFVFQSRSQQEFEQWMSQNPASITPEIEREWQVKIEAERKEHLDRLSGGLTSKVEMDLKGGAKVAKGMVTNNLADLADLPTTSREKLNGLGVTSIDQFKSMPYEEKQKALGNKVAARFKDFN